MPVFTNEQVIDERNRLLINWIAENLNLQEAKRDQFYSEMTMLFDRMTDEELTKFLWGKLNPQNVFKNTEPVKETIVQFHNIAHDWFSLTANNHRM